MKQIERFALVDQIGRELQKRMTYDDIDVYLQGFEIPPTNSERSYNSKWVYAKERLARATNDVVVRIADELGIPHSHVVLPGRDVEESRFWQAGHFRLFLSHLSTFKTTTKALQHTLRAFGISSFVAHVDIKPTRKWEQEIENALFSMDALVAILMPGFKESDWTDQEVGVAVGRGIPVIAVMRGLKPYGFISKYQGFDAAGKSVREVAGSIFEILLTNDRTSNKMWTALVDTLLLASSDADMATKLEVLESFEEVPKVHLERLRTGAEESAIVRESATLTARVNELLKRHGLAALPAPVSSAFTEPDDDLPF